jgi:hypothetical protein
VSSDDAEVGVSDPLKLCQVKDPDTQKRRIENIRRNRRVAVAAERELAQYSIRSTAVLYMKYYSTLHEVLEYLIVSTGHGLKHG